MEGWGVKRLFRSYLCEESLCCVFYTELLLDRFVIFFFLFHQDSLNWVYVAHDFFYDTVTYPES